MYLQLCGADNDAFSHWAFSFETNSDKLVGVSGVPYPAPHGHVKYSRDAGGVEVVDEVRISGSLTFHDLDRLVELQRDIKKTGKVFLVLFHLVLKCFILADFFFDI